MTTARHRTIATTDGVLEIASTTFFDTVVGDLTENGVLTVEVRRLAGGDEELRAVGTGARVGHGQQVRAVEGKFRVELVPNL